MNQKNSYTFAGVIFFIIWIVLMISFGIHRNIRADLTGDGGYEPARGVGHPLWQDY